MATKSEGFQVCKNETLQLAKQVLKQEAAAIEEIVNSINETFFHAVELILHTKGRVIVTGMGLSLIHI